MTGPRHSSYRRKTNWDISEIWKMWVGCPFFPCYCWGRTSLRWRELHWAVLHLAAGSLYPDSGVRQKLFQVQTGWYRECCHYDYFRTQSRRNSGWSALGKLKVLSYPYIRGARALRWLQTNRRSDTLGCWDRWKAPGRVRSRFHLAANLAWCFI